MTTSHWHRTHQFKTPDMTTDCLIIGAGFVGLSTAWWLTEICPDLKITVLDRLAVGSGASGRNAGFLTKGSAAFYYKLHENWGAPKALAVLNYMSESIQLVHQHILKTSPEFKFEKTSSLTLFQSESTPELWQNKKFQPSDFGFEWKSNSNLSQDLVSRYHGAFEMGDEYKINPQQLLSSLKRKLEARKVQIVENNSAFNLTADGVETELHKIKCDKVVLALNGYLPSFDSRFSDMIFPYRAQMMAVELDQMIDSASLHYDPEERVYWRHEGNQFLLIGGKRLLDEKGEVGFHEKLSPIIQQGLEDYLTNTLKISYKVIHRWSGTMGFTKHELPYLGQVSAPIPCFALGGFSGHGMGFGFKASQELAHMVAGNKSPSFFDSFSSFKMEGR